jgi:hypothetical protein
MAMKGFCGETGLGAAGGASCATDLYDLINVGMIVCHTSCHSITEEGVRHGEISKHVCRVNECMVR